MLVPRFLVMVRYTSSGVVVIDSSLESGNDTYASARISGVGVVVAGSGSMIKTSVLASKSGKDTSVGAKVFGDGLLGTSFGSMAFESRKDAGVDAKVFGNDLVATHAVDVKKGFSYAESLCKGGGLEKATKPFVSPSIPTCKPISLNLADEFLLEIEERTMDLSKDSIICHFKGFWPTLSKLHAWISKHWDPYITATIEIFPLVKGFFIVTFVNSKDRKAILCDQVFSWENQFPLMVKPWHLDFNPQTGSFKIPTWVRLPNLPLHFWVNYVFMEIGKALGDFRMVDS